MSDLPAGAMTPQEFADAHSLSLEEATLILSRRAKPATVGSPRLGSARSILALAQKRTGVQPVAVEGESLERSHDPDAERGLKEFYVGKASISKKVEFGESRTWDEFDQSGGDK